MHIRLVLSLKTLFGGGKNGSLHEPRWWLKNKARSFWPRWFQRVILNRAIFLGFCHLKPHILSKEIPERSEPSYPGQVSSTKNPGVPRKRPKPRLSLVGPGHSLRGRSQSALGHPSSICPGPQKRRGLLLLLETARGPALGKKLMYWIWCSLCCRSKIIFWRKLKAKTLVSYVYPANVRPHYKKLSSPA